MLRSLSRLKLLNSMYIASERGAGALGKFAPGSEFKANVRAERVAIHIRDQSVADIAAQELETDIAQGRLIIESNPGPGLLTKRLLDRGCQKLHLFSLPKSPFLEELLKIRDENPAKVKVIEEDILRMASVARYDVYNHSNRMDQFLVDFPSQSWDEEPSVTIVVPIPKCLERRFVLALLYALGSRSLIFSLGRVDFLVFMSADEYDSLISRKGKGTGPPLFDVFFDSKFVQSVSSEAFMTGRASTLRSPQYQISFVRLTPRTEIFNRFSEPRRVEEFIFFVNQVYRRGATLMYLNQLIPDSVRYILLRTRWSQTELLDLQPNTKLKSLAPQDLLRLFEILSHHHLYPQCPLTTAFEVESSKFSKWKSSN